MTKHTTDVWAARLDATTTYSRACKAEHLTFLITSIESQQTPKKRRKRQMTEALDTSKCHGRTMSWDDVVGSITARANEGTPAS